VLRHPATLALEPNTFLRVHGKVSGKSTEGMNRPFFGRLFGNPSRPAPLSPDEERQLADFINVNFIITYVTLQRWSTTRDPKEVIRLFEKFFFPEGSEDASTTGNTVKRLCERTPEYGIKKRP
jgi:hypothetical protein